MANGIHGISIRGLAATGTRDSTTFLRGDGAWAVPPTGSGGGGTTGSTSKDLRWTVGPGQTSIDEFNDASLDPAWVRVDSAGTPAAHVTYTEGADSLSAYNSGGDTAGAIHGLMRPIGAAPAVGDGFITHVALFGPGGNYTIGGLIVSDGVTAGAGNQVGPMTFFSNSGLENNNNHWTNWATASAQVADVVIPKFSGLYLRLALVAAGTWRQDISPDGVSWVKGPATIAWAGVPTHVGLISSSWGTATWGVASYEFLRRVSGVS